MCETHRQRWRRHGHPLQKTIKKKDLKPYLRYVEGLIKRDTTGKIKVGLQRIRDLIHAEAYTVYADFYERGRAMNARWVKACTEILRVLKSSDPSKPAIVIAAMFLIWADKPYLFVSDRGFYFEMVRQFRSLMPYNTGSYWNQRTGKVHKVYKDLSPRVVELMGVTVLDPYLSWVALVMDRWQRKKKQKDEAYSLIREGLSAGTWGTLGDGSQLDYGLDHGS